MEAVTGYSHSQIFAWVTERWKCTLNEEKNCSLRFDLSSGTTFVYS